MPVGSAQKTLNLLTNVGSGNQAPQQQGLSPTIPLEQQAQRPRQIPGLESVLEGMRQEPLIPTFDITTDEILAPTPEELLEDREGAKRMGLLAKFFPQQVAPIEEQLRRETLFPGGVGARQVGSVSGKIIGTQPIVVGGGGIFPLGIVQARQKALGDAAKKKKAIKNKVLSAVFAKGAIQIQDQLDDLSFKFIETGANIFGNDFSRATDLSNPDARKWWQGIQGLKTFGAETLELDKNADAILKEAVDKENFIPEENIKAALAYNEGSFDLEKLLQDPKGFAKMKDKIGRSYTNMVNVVRSEILPQLQQDIDFLADNITEKDLEIVMSTNDYDVVRQIRQKYVPKDRIKSLAKFTKNNFTLFQNEEEIEQFIDSMLGVEIQTDLRVGGKFNVQGREKLKRKEQEILGQTIFTTFTNRVLTNQAATKGLVEILDKDIGGFEKGEEMIDFFEKEIGLRSLDNETFVGEFALTAESIGKNVTDTYENISFFDKSQRKWVTFGSFKNSLLRKKAEGEELSEGELQLIEKQANDDVEAAITKITGELNFVNQNGNLQPLTVREALKNPQIVSGIVPTASTHYRIEGLPRARRVGDMTRLGAPAGMDAMVSKTQTQFRAGQKQKGTTGFRTGEETIVFD